jgi:hypothetical protein
MPVYWFRLEEQQHFKLSLASQEKFVKNFTFLEMGKKSNKYWGLFLLLEQNFTDKRKINCQYAKNAKAA